MPEGGEAMPRKPKRPCSYPGCPNLTDGQYCKEHEAIARRQYNKYERSADVNKKYGEPGSESVTAMLRRILSARCVSRKDG